MKKLFVVFCLSLIASCASFVNTSPHASADALCTNLIVPTPPPNAGKAMLGTCINGILQVNATITGGGTGPTPIPYPVNTAGVILVQPTNVPTIGVSVQNTSIPVTPATTFPVSGAFPTPIPFPTLGVVCISGCPTPLAVQPVSGTLTVNTPPPFSGSVTQGTSPWIVNTPVPFPTAIGGTLKVDGSAVTQPVSGSFPTPLAVQPVSGTVTANAGTGFPTPQPFATSAANLLNVSITGTNSVTQGTSPWVNNISQFGGAAFALGTAAIGSSISVTPATSATFPVSGTFFQGTQPVSGTVTANAGTGTFTVGQATGTNLHAILDTTSTTAVTQATGTNLHAVLDTTSTTAVTQATAANLNATAAQGGTWTVQPGNTANTTPWLATISQGGNSASVSAGGGLRTNPFIGTGGTSVQAVACNQSVVVNISTITTTALVAVSGATAVYVCSYDLEVTASSSGTWKLEYGTGAACVTTQTALTGTYTDSVGAHDFAGDGLGVLMTAPASNGLCMVTAGTSINIQGRLTFGQW